MRENFAEAPKQFILETTLPGQGVSRSYAQPIKVISAFEPEDLPAAFQELTQAQAEGLYLAGFLSYEAGYALEPKLQSHLAPQTEFPLLWFVAYKTVQPLAPGEVDNNLSRSESAELTPLNAELTPRHYQSKILQVQDLIRAGDIYQANFTYRAHGKLQGTPAALYRRLRRAQPVAYSAFIESDNWSVLSLSPELFFDISDGLITSRPMKGTAPRTLLPQEDAAARTALQKDPKQRAENLMILDLIRNDLARISEAGSVKVPERFSIETYRTVHQMTSTVTAQMSAGKSIEDILRALFPCGSVTGAPKIRAMEILADLETSPRGLYTGAIGFIDPNGHMTFNVAIRTLILSRETERLWQVEAGVGGGIVADSTPEGEWAECQTKLSYLNLAKDEGEDFKLLETLRWSAQGGLDLYQRHIDRLKTSAAFFAFAFDSAALDREINSRLQGLEVPEAMVRLLLERSGNLEVDIRPLSTTEDEVWTFALAKNPVSSNDPFLYHKTTRRGVYDRALASVQADGPCDEVLLFNEKGFLTEGSRTNLFLKINGQLLTPPLRQGVLDGTLRRELLETGKAKEQDLTPKDLEGAEAIYFGNSVRGLIRAERRK
ncbi:MAG: aminodeoxychorismate synthase component I [Alphaproteobacteria bacterium]|nr:MAG: aminodeoxychorismate synthase component I [Alphaproteobacteria bacterium]